MTYVSTNLFLIALILGVSSLPAAAGAPTSLAVLFPGGVTDSAGRHGYLTNPSGGVDALDLATGKLLWKSDEAMNPVLVTDESLVAIHVVKQNQVRFVTLDPSAAGKVKIRSEPVTFPEWVSVEPAPGRGFNIEAGLIGREVVLHWEAKAWYAGGAPPPPAVAERAKKSADGVIRFEPKTGSIKASTSEQDPFSPHKSIPKGLSDVTSHPYWHLGAWSTKPMVVGSKVISLVAKDQELHEQLILKKWDLKSGRPDEQVSLVQGPAFESQVTLDGRHLFVQVVSGKKKASNGWLFSLPTGTKVAEISMEAGVRDMSVIGSRVYYATALKATTGKASLKRSLVALELPAGTPLWTHPIRGYSVPKLRP